MAKLRIEKYKIILALPPGGNKTTRLKTTWTSTKHPFDSRPSIRELLVKSRVCRSVMNVNQKNIKLWSYYCLFEKFEKAHCTKYVGHSFIL